MWTRWLSPHLSRLASPLQFSIHVRMTMYLGRIVRSSSVYNAIYREGGYHSKRWMRVCVFVCFECKRSVFVCVCLCMYVVSSVYPRRFESHKSLCRLSASNNGQNVANQQSRTNGHIGDRPSFSNTLWAWLHPRLWYCTICTKNKTHATTDDNSNRWKQCWLCRYVELFGISMMTDIMFIIF